MKLAAYHLTLAFFALGAHAAEVLRPELQVFLPGTSEAVPVPAGRVIAWGSNNYGQTTVPVAAQSGVVAISAGYDHAVALKQDGSVIAWGYNVAGQATVPAAANHSVMAIAAGAAYTVALKQDGTGFGWGYNFWGQSSVPAFGGLVAIAAGQDHSVALNHYGKVFAWGYLDNVLTKVPDAAQSGVIAIAAGDVHTAALKLDSSVIAWGHNDDGQTTVPAAAQSGAVAIAAGEAHTVAVKRDGSVIAWGRNNFGQATVPATAQTGVISVAAGWGHTVALNQDGNVIAWGRDTEGQTSVPAAATKDVVAISAGSTYTMALKSSLMPPSLAFGDAIFGSFVDRTITLKSTGAYDVQALTADLSGEDAAQFSIISPPLASTLAAGSTTEMTLRFTPQRVGKRTALLKLRSSDPARPCLVLAITGTGNFDLIATKPIVANSPFTYAPLRQDRQTGLVLQKISFTNATGFPLHGLRLFLSKVSNGVQVYSSSVGTEPGTLEVIYPKAIRSNETISFDLVYFDPARSTTAMNPVIKAEALLEPEPNSPPVPGAVVPLLSARNTAQGPWLEWNAVSRKPYVVEYSDDAGQTWFSAVHRLSKIGTRMFWIDRGPPETRTKPVGIPNHPGGRFYRVKKL
jgi:hypothetical protein